MRRVLRGASRPAGLLAIVLLAGLLALMIGALRPSGGVALTAGVNADPAVVDATVVDTTVALCRYGVDSIGDLAGYPIEELRVGWYWNWTWTGSASAPANVEFMPTVRFSPSPSGGYTLPYVTLQAVTQAAAQYPGRVWFLGNEPDSPYQDNLEPHVYAEAYHDLYHAIKAADPTARIANGGIVQVTPARLLYLDMVLDSYAERYGQAMPVDVWNIHVYVLQERSCDYDPANCSGAELPPGVDWPVGEQYTIDDNASVDVFKKMVRDFRAWMARKGYQDRPLIVSEFGVQMPADYGFPPARVNAYMDATLDFMRTAVGPEGYPADKHRLVQQWAWWSLQMPPGETYLLSNGWLYDRGSPPQRTVIGDNFAAYTAQIDPVVNLFPVRVYAQSPLAAAPTDSVTVTLSAQIANDGEVAHSGSVVVRFYRGLPGDTSQQIGFDQVITDLGGCGRSEVVSVTMPSVIPGRHPVYVVVDPDGEVSERDEQDNLLEGTVLVATERVFLPLTNRK